jgi:glycerol-3-phosphate acyltransferase PlsX
VADLESGKTLIAIDAMGGDHGISVTVPASLTALSSNSNLSLILVGNQSLIESALQGKQFDKKRLQVINAFEVVEMDEKPSDALRKKKDSSMRVAINLVKEGKAQAIISAGNTGALMAIARFVLKTHANIDRPAIVTTVPTIKGSCHLLDMGANVDCSSEQLFQFAVMGSILSSVHGDIEKPKIGLLNIGEEELKGNDQIQQTHARLQKAETLNYVGFVEGDGIAKAEVDVVVADGFVGNIALKTMEGTGRLVAHMLKEAATESLLMKLLTLLAYPMLKKFQKKMDPDAYNGASLVGLKGIVIKSHGGVGEFGFLQAIRVAEKEVERDVPELIRSRFEKLANDSHKQDSKGNNSQVNESPKPDQNQEVSI